MLMWWLKGMEAGLNLSIEMRECWFNFGTAGGELGLDGRLAQLFELDSSPGCRFTSRAFGFKALKTGTFRESYGLARENSTP